MATLEILEGETYDDAMRRVAAEGATPQEIMGFAREHNDAVFDLDNLPKIEHDWHDQGEKLSCWNAGHPMHQVWKPRKGMPIS